MSGFPFPFASLSFSTPHEDSTSHLHSPSIFLSLQCILHKQPKKHFESPPF